MKKPITVTYQERRPSQANGPLLKKKTRLPGQKHAAIQRVTYPTQRG